MEHIETSTTQPTETPTTPEPDYDYTTLRDLSSEDLTGLVAPGLRITGFSTVDDGEDFIKAITSAVFRGSFDRDGEPAANVDQGPIALHGTGALDTILRRRRHMTSKSVPFETEVLSPLVFELLPESTDGLTNPDSIVGPQIRIKVSGRVMTRRPELMKTSFGVPTKTIILNDEVIIYSREKKINTGAVKPHMYVATRSLDKSNEEDAKSDERKRGSSERWYNAIVQALQNPYSAGAFGQGKKS